MKIVLASGSPRRAKILKDLGVDFEVVKTDAPEVSYPADPERTVSENALAKGAALLGRKGVLSADTILLFSSVYIRLEYLPISSATRYLLHSKPISSRPRNSSIAIRSKPACSTAVSFEP